MTGWFPGALSRTTSRTLIARPESPPNTAATSGLVLLIPTETWWTLPPGPFDAPRAKFKPWLIVGTSGSQIVVAVKLPDESRARFWPDRTLTSLINGSGRNPKAPGFDSVSVPPDSTTVPNCVPFQAGSMNPSLKSSASPRSGTAKESTSKLNGTVCADAATGRITKDSNNKDLSNTRLDTRHTPLS